MNIAIGGKLHCRGVYLGWDSYMDDRLERENGKGGREDDEKE